LFTPGAIEALQANPQLGGLLNEILESAGMNPRNFASSTPRPTQQQAQLPAQPQEEVALPT